MSAEMRTEAAGDFAYQLVGEEYCATHDDVMLTWGYSTGKTRVCLTRLVRDPRITTVLYFTRKNNVKPTSREILKHSTVELVSMLGSTQHVRNVVQQFSRSLRSQSTVTVFIANYDKARTCYDELASLNPQAVIVDESTAIKHDSKRTKAIIGLCHLPSVVFRCMMTGEPAPQDKQNYYHQFQGAYGSRNPLGRTYYAFRNNFFHKMDWEFILKPGARERLLKVVSENSCIMRTDDVRIPIRTDRRTIGADITAEQKKYMAMLTEGCVVWDDNVAWMPTNPAVSYEKRVQVCSGFINRPPDNPESKEKPTPIRFAENPKLDLLRDLFDGDLQDHLAMTGPKVAIWARRNVELDDIHTLLNEMKIGHVMIRGSQTANTNDAGLVRMLNDPSIRVCVLQADMGYGLNELITCDTSIWYSNSFSVESRMQAEMRFDRPGQQYRLLTFIDLVCNDQEDEVIALAVGVARMDCKGFTSKAQLMQAIKRKGELSNDAR